MLGRMSGADIVAAGMCFLSEGEMVTFPPFLHSVSPNSPLSPTHTRLTAHESVDVAR